MDHPSHVQAYLQKEIEMGAIEGPLEESPFPSCHVSPFMSRPKPNSDSRRVIVDLSWPKGESANDGLTSTDIWVQILRLLALLSIT